jgi:hypothetical protein
MGKLGQQSNPSRKELQAVGVVTMSTVGEYSNSIDLRKPGAKALMSRLLLQISSVTGAIPLAPKAPPSTSPDEPGRKCSYTHKGESSIGRMGQVQ